MYAFEKTAELLTKTNAELKSQHQVAAKALNSLVQAQFGLLSQGLGNAFTAAEKFTLLSGEHSQTEYLFNKHAIHHLCGTCRAHSFLSNGCYPDFAW